MLLPRKPSESSDGSRKTALIVEGGAMRGAWAAGVLAFLYERGQRRFDLVYAASSGACSAAYFVAGMLEPGLTIWRKQACKAVRKSNCLRRKPIIDLAYLVDHIFRQHVPLSIAAIRNAPTSFYIVLTDCETGGPVYFHARDERVFDALRATASMPIATRGYDYVEGYPYADGGLSDPIPVRRAIEDGATDITVVLTHRSDFRLRPMPRWLAGLVYPRFPEVAENLVTRQHQNYNAALDLMKNPPPGIRLQVFRPIKPMPVGLLTIAQKRIDAALASGRDEAREQMGADAALNPSTTQAAEPLATADVSKV